MRVLTAEEKEGIRRFLDSVTPERVESRIRETIARFPEVDAWLASGTIQPAEDRTPERVLRSWADDDLFASVRWAKDDHLEFKGVELEDGADLLEGAAKRYALFGPVDRMLYLDLRLNARVPPAQAAALAEKTYREVVAQRLQHLRELAGGGVSVVLQPAPAEP